MSTMTETELARAILVAQRAVQQARAAVNEAVKAEHQAQANLTQADFDLYTLLEQVQP